jgi:RNA polymerase sigma-70 factor (ECF subfamily)
MVPKTTNQTGAAQVLVLPERCSARPARRGPEPTQPVPLRRPPLSDAALLDGLRRRDAAAARELYTRFSPDVNRVVWKLLGGDSEHNDLVHDVFVIAWSEIARGKRPRDLSGWMVGIAANRVRREIRKRGVRRRFAQLVVATGPRSARPNVEGPDLLRRVYGLLEQLRAEDRIAYSLRYLDRRSLEETAQACGCSLATVKRRIQRAQKRLLELAASYPDIHELFAATEGCRSASP